MHFFSSVQFSAVALLLLPALFASAHPHLHDRSNPIPPNEIHLLDPAGGAGEIATLKLEGDRYELEPEGTFYQFYWEAPGGGKKRATATRVSEGEYNELVTELVNMGRYISCGLDNKKHLWVVEEGWAAARRDNKQTRAHQVMQLSW